MAKIKGKKIIYLFSPMPPETRRERVYEDPRERNKIYEYMVKNSRYGCLMSVADCLGLDAARVKHLEIKPNPECT